MRHLDNFPLKVLSQPSRCLANLAKLTHDLDTKRTQENTWGMKGSFIDRKLLQVTLESLDLVGWLGLGGALAK